MHPTPLCSLLYVTLFLGYVAAAPAATSGKDVGCKPRTLCIDGINTCGVRYGGCYDTCKTELRPVAPYCASTTAETNTSSAGVCAPTTATPTTTTLSSTRPVPTPTGKCPDGVEGSGMTVCWDGINSCGMMYGGCFKDCKPWPTFTAPPCRSKASTSTPASTTAQPTLA